jgi:hypothetical protein
MIEVIERSDHRLVRLAGRLAEAQVPDLFGVCGEPPIVIHLDLGNLISVDAVGLEALNRLRLRGVAFIEVPAYIQLKLDSISARQPARRRDDSRRDHDPVGRPRHIRGDREKDQ